MYKGNPLKLSADLQQKHYIPEGTDMTYSRYWKEKLIIKSTLLNKAIIQDWKRDKSFLDKQKLKEFITTSFTGNVRDTSLNEKENAIAPSLNH